MAWQDRIKEVKYTSPSGQEFTFFYENLSVESEKKTAEFIFPEIDGAYIQDMGRAGRKFPFTIYFSGEDYDTDADSFLAALEEKGIGKLEHPVYGNRKVIPTGAISRRDDLISEANQAAFSVTFSETIDLEFPQTKENTADVLNKELDNTAATASAEYASSVQFTDGGAEVGLKIQAEQELSLLDKILQPLVKFSDSVLALYEEIKTSLINNFNDLAAQLEPVAAQAIELYRTTSATVEDIKTRVGKYVDAYNQVKDYVTGIIEGKNNAYFETAKNIYGIIVALCQSTINYSYSTRNEAVETSEMILDLYDDLKDFIDQNIVELGITDTGAGFEAVSSLISKTCGFLVSESFSLPSEKKVVLGNSTDLFSLTYEIYGNLDNIDDIIINNDLTADEIESLPALKEIVYYG